jgi:1,4-dihydroxy-2-naphthoate octaprenyltransferase
MGIGAGLFLIALGAILAFAIDVDLSGINIAVIGWILMLVGIVGILLSIFYWGPRKRRGIVRETVYPDDPTQPPPPI